MLNGSRGLGCTGCYIDDKHAEKDENHTTTAAAAAMTVLPNKRVFKNCIYTDARLVGRQTEERTPHGRTQWKGGGKKAQTTKKGSAPRRTPGRLSPFGGGGGVLFGGAV